MQFESFFPLFATVVVVATSVQGAAIPSVIYSINICHNALIVLTLFLQFVPTATITETETFTVSQIFEAVVPTPPYLVESTTCMVVTVTETDTLYATYTAAT